DCAATVDSLASDPSVTYRSSMRSATNGSEASESTVAAQSSARLKVQMATAARRTGLVVVVLHVTSDTVAAESTAWNSSHMAPPSVNMSTGTPSTAIPSPEWRATSTVRTCEP